MKRNTLTAWLLGIILIFSATSCFNSPIVKGSKNYITKKENLEHFNDISMSGSANIIYQQDSSSRIEIYGSDNIVELLETKVNGKTLNIKFKKNVNIIDKGKLEIKVFSPDLNGLTLNGSGGILFANGIHTEGDLKVTINGSGNLGGSTFDTGHLAISIHGSGDVRLKQIDSKTCSASISGSGNITLDGMTDAAKYNISGSGNIKAVALEATDVYAGISGSGNISCFVNGKLGGHVSGSGNVAYKGNPQAIDFPHKKLRKLD